MSPARVLVATFGSGGDVFPLVPLVRELVAQGVEVRVATGRGPGLYLRSLGIATVGLGDGSELAVVDDPAAFTNRFGGWSSWRRTVDAYVAPTLARDVAVLDALFDRWIPDLLIASGFAAAARVAGMRRGIPLLDLSIYPQHQRLADEPGRFARRFVTTVAGLLDTVPSDPLVRRAAWGAPADVLLHDRALLGDDLHPDLAPVGFPSGEIPEGDTAEGDALDAWLAVDEGPVLLATLGSFIGLAQEEAWRSVVVAGTQEGFRVGLVGPRGRWARNAFGDRSEMICVGFVRLDERLRRADVVVHHGGIGTTFAAIRAGRPSLVLPQSFDQGFNAGMVQAAGVGLDGRTITIAEGLRRLREPHCVDAVQGLAARLVPADLAHRAVVQAVIARG